MRIDEDTAIVIIILLIPVIAVVGFIIGIVQMITNGYEAGKGLVYVCGFVLYGIGYIWAKGRE